MKRFNLLMFALIIGVAFSGCNPLKKMNKDIGKVRYSPNPTILELIGDSVTVAFSGTYPAKYFHKKVTVTLSPVLQAGSNELDLPELKAEGEDVKSTENNKVIKFESGGSVQYSNKVGYSPEFQQSVAMLNVVGTDHKNRSLAFPSVKLAEGIVTTSLLVEKKGKVIFEPVKYDRIVPSSYEADIKYELQQAEVRTRETQKPEIAALTDALKEAAANERMHFTGTQLSAYASPEGPTDLNERLSESRRRSGSDFFSRSFRTARVSEAISDDLLKVVVTPEDWDGFKTAMERSNIRDKELILRVLSMHSDPMVREREIKNMSAAYEEIKVQILPQLRRTKLVVNVEYHGLTSEEINAQFDKDPSVLKIEEILHAGDEAQDQNRKLAIYQAAARQYPDDFRANNNFGAALLNVERNAEARTALEQAKKITDNETVKNNLAVVALREGNLELAEELLNSAGSKSEVKYNLGTVKIIQGQYGDAVTHFGSQPEINAALAKLLAKDNEGALSTLNSVRSEDALVYYLKAIVGARLSNNDLLMNNLRTACSKSAELKANAGKDIEFAKFFQDATFQSIVQ